MSFSAKANFHQLIYRTTIICNKYFQFQFNWTTGSHICSSYFLCISNERFCKDKISMGFNNVSKIQDVINISCKNCSDHLLPNLHLYLVSQANNAIQVPNQDNIGNVTGVLLGDGRFLLLAAVLRSSKINSITHKTFGESNPFWDNIIRLSLPLIK
ncbi:hypothetical protein LOAG_06531 [Loa loa]|uniref:Uncharacterized protein n=1 Tax=Loa loa TaxID=7209 RepID=A0A1S0TXM4_LOALO|nr:hypothetical protein LOAG_06531 [Loa loa]EFO21955.1 hypothetical protein LOAG_06531 [Loa loa]